MTEVFSLNSLPNCRLQVSAVVAEQHRSIGDVVVMTQAKLRHQLADTVLKETRMFSVTEATKGYFTIRADVIVLTSEEFADLMQRQFRAGVDHAQGFMPREFQL